MKKTGVTRKVAGYACEEWLISMGGMMTMTECVTNDLKYPVQSWAALAEFQESMRKSMSFGPSAKSGADYAEKMKSIKGFPVATTTTVDAGVMKTTTATEVTEVSRTPIPAFDVGGARGLYQGRESDVEVPAATRGLDHALAPAEGAG